VSVIAQRIWREPSVAIGAFVSVVVLAIALAKTEPWNLSTIAGIVAPLASSLGIRPLVTPTAVERSDDAA
jgi:uncharacterized membrane protein YgaE (UPF0421/DUF939 family)